VGKIAILNRGESKRADGKRAISKLTIALFSTKTFLLTTVLWENKGDCVQNWFKLQSYAGTMVLLVMKFVECNRSVDEVGENRSVGCFP
jgi:hypothetical protein